MVFADKEKIRQVINNLVVNASKYGKQDGAIVASVYKTDAEHVLIEISDDGIGIAEEHLSRIFERFYRTSGGRNKDVKGSGLGLAVSKMLVEQMAGSIGAEPREGKGSRFWIKLPLTTIHDI